MLNNYPYETKIFVHFRMIGCTKHTKVHTKALQINYNE